MWKETTSENLGNSPRKEGKKTTKSDGILVLTERAWNEEEERERWTGKKKKEKQGKKWKTHEERRTVDMQSRA